MSSVAMFFLVGQGLFQHAGREGLCCGIFPSLALHLSCGIFTWCRLSCSCPFLSIFAIAAFTITILTIIALLLVLDLLGMEDGVDPFVLDLTSDDKEGLKERIGNIHQGAGCLVFFAALLQLDLAELSIPLSVHNILQRERTARCSSTALFCILEVAQVLFFRFFKDHEEELFCLVENSSRRLFLNLDTHVADVLSSCIRHHRCKIRQVLSVRHPRAIFTLIMQFAMQLSDSGSRLQKRG